MKKLNKKAQEEMIGFVLIIIMVSVIMLIFLVLSITNNQVENVESYEVESFIQAILQHTTECENNLEPLSVQKLIFSCNNNEFCESVGSSCYVLNETLKKLASESWRAGEDSPVKGYSFEIYSGGNNLLSIVEGNVTKNSRGSLQDFSRGGTLIEIRFDAYY